MKGYGGLMQWMGTLLLPYAVTLCTLIVPGMVGAESPWGGYSNAQEQVSPWNVPTGREAGATKKMPPRQYDWQQPYSSRPWGEVPQEFDGAKSNAPDYRQKSYSEYLWERDYFNRFGHMPEEAPSSAPPLFRPERPERAYREDWRYEKRMDPRLRGERVGRETMEYDPRDDRDRSIYEKEYWPPTLRETPYQGDPRYPSRERSEDRDYDPRYRDPYGAREWPY